ncbi:ZIP-like iron-zinc transporter [Cystobasidium minutum MCA 4210]|uniref:ZIP-like iron-zinc transporter n=1 Tax=Cystobasidium minutum MCA 4210 TaxID=1397322 RepID=UPI0034CDA96C|eukprot:jgi/Rhomi1/194247/gm1.2461_g
MADAGADVDACSSFESTYNGSFGLRLGGLFIILATSTLGTLFPIVAKRAPRLSIPPIIFEFTKYFGSGVIIATAFIHLLDPAIEELGNPCLTGEWTVYPWAIAIAMMSVFGIFTLELIAHRLGSSFMDRLGIEHDTHGPGVAHGPERITNHSRHADHDHPHTRHGDEELLPSSEKIDKNGDVEVMSIMSHHEAAAQIIGVAILEFGVVVHSVIIGLTLAVTDELDTLLVVIIFHQMFEGLGLGTRLAFLPLPPRLNWVPYVAGVIYAICTPIGMAIGLGVRETYSPESVTASIVSGILDAISAGILLYTGLVELLAHEFLFNDAMRKAPAWKVAFALGVTMLGAGIMALLGRWA